MASFFKKLAKGAGKVLSYTPPGFIAGKIGKAFEARENPYEAGLAELTQTGFRPGEKEKLLGGFSRELGARSALESSLLSERGRPGDSGFEDNIYTQIAANARQALGQYETGLDELGTRSRSQALGQLYGAKQEQEAQRQANAYGLAQGIFQGAGQLGAASSSKVYKKNIRPVYSTISAKTNIKIPSKRSMLGALKSLDLKTYQYKDGIEPEDDGKEHIGVLAEETPDNLKAGRDKVDLSDILFMTVGALQELSAKVEQLSGASGLSALRETPETEVV